MTLLFKWAGGKNKMMPLLDKYVPKAFERYHEPMVGGGAMLLHLKPKQAYIYDINPWLQKVWQHLIWNVDVTYDRFWHHPAWDDVRLDDFTFCRDRLNRPGWTLADFFFFNRTCFNGLFRVNKSGLINTPKGTAKKVNRDLILNAIHEFQSWAVGNVVFDTMNPALAGPGDFYFFDPPYYGTFDKYNAGGFSDADRKDLAEGCAFLVARGARVLLTDSPEARPFYEGLPGLTCAIEGEMMTLSCDSARRGITPTLVVYGGINVDP